MKKILSMMLVVAMIIAMIPYSAIAASGETVIDIVDGPGYVDTESRSGMVVTPEITVVSGPQPAGYKYQWYIKNNAGNQEEYILPWETGPSFTVHTQLSNGWWVYFEATPLDSEGNAIGNPVKERYISASPFKGRSAIPTVTVEQSELYKDTPKDYLFEVDGKKFILLDVRYNGDYYVMTEESVAEKPYDTRGNGKVFSTEEGNIGHWLNNDFFNGDYLPQSMKDNIAEEYWTTEGAKAEWGPDSKKFKIGLMSYSEYVAYMGRFGFWLSCYDATNPKGWEAFWLRTLRNGDRTYAVAKNGGKDDGTGILGTLGYFAANQEKGIFVRPTFRLSKNFFIENKIDLVKAGSKVKEAIALCGIENLEGLYTRKELIEGGLIKKPEIKGFSVKGTFLAGDTVECDYLWFSDNGAQDVGSVYGFSVSNSQKGPYTDVAENVKTYTISANDVGKYLTFYVTPVDSNGITGELYRSKPVLISEAAKVIVTDCGINGQNVSITLESLTQNDPTTVIVMAAVYDAGNSLTGSYAVQASVPAGETVTLDNLSIDSAQGSVVKIMVWDSFESMNCIYLSEI